MSRYGTTYTKAFIKDATHNVPISCRALKVEDRGELRDFPMLEIGDITIFATTEQLREIHQAIGTWLDAEEERVRGVADVNPMEPEPEIPMWRVPIA